MMNEEKLLTVARYLEGDMELQEKERFETSIQTDAELQQLIAEYKDVHQTLKMKIAPDEADKQLEATLSAFGKQYFTGDTAQKDKRDTSIAVFLKPYLKWMSVAAVLIIGLLIWAPWSAGLYEKYAISKQMSVVERGEAGEDNLEKAAELYNAGDFTAASALLQREYEHAPGNALVAYYYGITLIETAKAEQGRTVLTKIYEGESAFKYNAAYYIALSYVKEKNNKDALSWLEKIPQGTSPYDKAQDLILKLN